MGALRERTCLRQSKRLPVRVRTQTGTCGKGNS